MTGRSAASPPTPKPADTTGSEAPHGQRKVNDSPFGSPGTKRRLAPPKGNKKR